MAIANACMEVIRDEKLQENAEIVGEYTKAKLRDLKEKHAIIGDVRSVKIPVCYISVHSVQSRISDGKSISQQIFPNSFHFAEFWDRIAIF